LSVLRYRERLKQVPYVGYLASAEYSREKLE
jgi:hypothetical protein